MASIQDRYAGREGARRLTFLVAYTKPDGKRSIQIFKDKQNACEFKVKIEVLEENWKADRIIRKLEAAHGMGRQANLEAQWQRQDSLHCAICRSKRIEASENL